MCIEYMINGKAQDISKTTGEKRTVLKVQYVFCTCTNISQFMGGESIKHGIPGTTRNVNWNYK